jgi:hypothetical protein
MNKHERATQIWAVLALAAHNRQVLTYSLISKLIGVPTAGLGQLLEPIQSYCLLNNLPPLTILVVSSENGMPGTGFIAASHIPKAQQAVFAYNWIDHNAPSADIFKVAVEQRPSNGFQSSTLGEHLQEVE